MEVKAKVDILFWDEPKKVDKEERQLIKVDESFVVDKKGYDRVKEYVTKVSKKEG